MIFKPEFQNLMNRLSVSPGQQDFASVIWSAAERVCHGKPTQVPSLLKDKSLNRVKEDVAFTQQDLMFLKKFLASSIRVLDEMQKEEKYYAAIQWSYCDKADPKTLVNFAVYNKAKDNERKFKAALNKLSKIQRKVKKQLSS